MSFWPILTRLGEAEILLPMALLTALLLFRQRETRRLALLWMALLLTAATLTTLSKLAFMGWGLGSAALNFTGVSGHAMFSSAIYPLLLRSYLAGAQSGRDRWALLLGAALALLVGLSRLALGVHSVSEVLAGWLLGGGATGTVLLCAQPAGMRVRALLPALLLAWVALMPLHLQPSQTHSQLTRLALQLSGRAHAFTREELLQGTSAQEKGP